MKLGIGIPYYKNSPECETAFKKLMKTLELQLRENVYLFIFEDGQTSEWLDAYKHDHILIYRAGVNHGVAYARNVLLDAMIKNYKCDYILYIDSDDMVDCDFITTILDAANTGNYDMIISKFIWQKNEVYYARRSNVAGVCLRVDFIKDITFNEEYMISEDTIFINDVYARNPRIFVTDSRYYYNYGINPNSLMMRYERSEIGIKK